MLPILYSPSAEKFFKKLKDKKLKEKFRDAILKIRENPGVGERKTGDLAGMYCYDLYYNRTNYEIAYMLHIEGETVVVVIMAGTRENFYQALKKYMPLYR